MANLVPSLMSVGTRVCMMSLGQALWRTYGHACVKQITSNSVNSILLPVSQS